MLLTSALQAADPLSQVIFIHDYVQLRFQDTCLSLYSRLKVETARGVVARIDQGFCDELVALIDQRVASVDYRAKNQLRLTFEGGAILTASLLAEDAAGEELFQLDQPGHPSIVEQVA